ncbi:MAG: hypothetical protein AAFY21_04905, partial [Cyanobacteria bacterium J06641_2]
IIAVILTLLIHKQRHSGGGRYNPRSSNKGCKALRRKLLNLVHYNTADRLMELTYIHPIQAPNYRYNIYI